MHDQNGWSNSGKPFTATWLGQHACSDMGVHGDRWLHSRARRSTRRRCTTDWYFYCGGIDWLIQSSSNGPMPRIGPPNLGRAIDRPRPDDASQRNMEKGLYNLLED